MQLKHISFSVISRIPRLWIMAGCILLIIISTLLLFRREKHDGVGWVTVEKGEFVIELVESGEIRSLNSQYIKAPNIWWGEPQVIQMVPEGTIVKQGDFLAQFDTSDMEKELLTRREGLATLEAELKALDTEQERRYAELESNQTGSQYSKELAELRRELSKFESPLIQRQADLQYQRQMLMLDEEGTRLKNQKIIDAAARGRLLRDLEHTRRWVDNIEQRIKEMTLYAPAGGMVVFFETGGHGSPRKKVAEGDRVYPGQPIIFIPDQKTMQMVARVNEVDASDITVGSRVNITLDAFEEAHYIGNVVSIAKLADRRNYRSQIKDFEVAIDIAEPDTLLKPGMTVKGTILLSRKENILYAPIGAVFEQKDGAPVVFKRKSPDKPTPVVIGKRNDRFVMIGDGIGQGEQLSLFPPVTGEFYPLGRAREMERRAREMERLKATPDSLLITAQKEKPGPGDSTQGMGGEGMQRGEAQRDAQQMQQRGSEGSQSSGERQSRGEQREEGGNRPAGRN